MPSVREALGRKSPLVVPRTLRRQPQRRGERPDFQRNFGIRTKEEQALQTLTRSLCLTEAAARLRRSFLWSISESRNNSGFSFSSLLYFQHSICFLSSALGKDITVGASGAAVAGAGFGCFRFAVESRRLYALVRHQFDIHLC